MPLLVLRELGLAVGRESQAASLTLQRRLVHNGEHHVGVESAKHRRQPVQCDVERFDGVWCKRAPLELQLRLLNGQDLAQLLQQTVSAAGQLC